MKSFTFVRWCMHVRLYLGIKSTIIHTGARLPPHISLTSPRACWQNEQNPTGGISLYLLLHIYARVRFWVHEYVLCARMRQLCSILGANGREKVTKKTFVGKSTKIYTQFLGFPLVLNKWLLRGYCFSNKDMGLRDLFLRVVWASRAPVRRHLSKLHYRPHPHNFYEKNVTERPWER